MDMNTTMNMPVLALRGLTVFPQLTLHFDVGRAASIQALERRVVAEWLPTSGYEYAEGPDVEVYLNGPDAAEAQFQVWLPVQRSKTQ